MHFKYPGPFRILILGLPGSGKSTLARKLSLHLKIRHIESDKFFWTEARVQVPREKFLQDIVQELQSNDFVIEGHFKDLKELLHEASLSHVLWLDPDFKTVLWRLFKREFSRKGISGILSPEGNFRFLLRNHSRLRDMQAKSFADFKGHASIEAKRLTKLHETLNF